MNRPRENGDSYPPSHVYHTYLFPYSKAFLYSSFASQENKGQLELLLQCKLKTYNESLPPIFQMHIPRVTSGIYELLILSTKLGAQEIIALLYQFLPWLLVEPLRLYVEAII